MKQRRFNKSALDADVRDKGLYSGERLDVKIARRVKRMRAAHKAFEEQREQRELDNEFDFGEDDE